MTEIWKDGDFIADDWVMVAGGDKIPADRPAFVSLQRWRSGQSDLAGRNAPVGLAIDPNDNWDDIVGDLPRFRAIAIAFPTYADGRGFSIARLLRDRDRYEGEIRAVGGFFVDQIPYMRRVGFTAFAIDNPKLRDALAQGVWPEVRRYLQPVNEALEVPAGTRPWARRPVNGDGR